jgi:site-specific DNA-methyltransferase (adenine-specific)
LIIQDLSVSDLIPYANNPRRNDAAVDIVMKSIREFGFKVPIVIDQHNVIVTGHTRLKAALRLGMATVPCIMADDLTDEQIKAFRLADNKTAEYAEWDLDKLEAELKGLQGFDFAQFDFKLQEAALDDEFNLEEAVEAVKDPVTQPGDVWALGRHRLLCGDSTKREDVMRLMNGDKAKLVITDPPYNVDYTGGGKAKMKILNDSMPDARFRVFLTDAYLRMFEVMEPGAPIYVFHADSEGYNFRAAFKDAGFKLAQCLVWVKQSLVLGRQDYQWRHEPILYGWKEGAAHFWYGNRDKDTVLDEDKISFTKAKKEDLIATIKELQQKLYDRSTIVYHDKPSLNGDHPTMKPVKLIGRLMANSSDRGFLVLDPFGGSGSTLMAAEQLGRTCYTLELDPVYCDVIVKRWEEYTGQTAQRING